MSRAPQNAVTQLLAAVGQGDRTAHDELWSLVYDELHHVAKHQMHGEGRKQTLQTTVLVNEAYLRLVGDGNVQWNDRRHFFAAAALAMRRIRVDHARSRDRLKRGGGDRPVPLLDEPPVLDQDPAQVLAIDEALRKFERESPHRAEVVMLRYFAGLSREETADALGVSPSTVDKYWQYARAWLHRELS